MKYSIAITLILSLYLVGCGGSDSGNDSTPTPTNPIPPQSNENTSVTILGSNANIARLNNVVQATFSIEDASNNPKITLSKVKIPEALTIISDQADFYDIQRISNDEIKIVTSKPLLNELDIKINVPSSLSQLSDEQGIVPYIVTFDAYDEGESITPLETVYYEDDQSIQVKLPVAAFSSLENGSWESVIKLGVTKLFPLTANLSTQTKNLTGKSEDSTVSETKPVIKCPLPIECVEVSPFSSLRYVNGIGAAHLGVDLRANSELISVPVDNEFRVAAADTTMDRPNAAGNRIHLHSTTGMLGLSFFHLTRDSIIEQLKKDDQNRFLNLKFGDVFATSGASGATKKTDKDGKVIRIGNENAYKPHLHLQVFLPELLYKKCKNQVCIVPELNNVKNLVDPFPYILQKVELKNINEQATLEVGKPFILQLEGYDGTNKESAKKVRSEITRTHIKNKVRIVKWESSDSTAIKFENVSDNPIDYDKQKVTLLKDGNYTVTAYWDGLENLKANYVVSSVGKDPIVQADIELYYEYEEFPALRAIYDCINCNEDMLARITKWIYAEVECIDIANPSAHDETKYLSLETPIKNKKGILNEYIVVETGYESYQIISLPGGRWSGNGVPPSKVIYECNFKDTEYGVGSNYVRKLQLVQNPVKFSSTLVKRENDYYYLPFVREK